MCMRMQRLMLLVEEGQAANRLRPRAPFRLGSTLVRVSVRDRDRVRVRVRDRVRVRVGVRARVS